jgi:hypothetical protein
MSDKLPEELKNEEVILCQIVFQGAEIYILNVYLNNFTKKRSLLKPIKNCIIQIQKTKPKALVIVSGDFNSHKNPLDGLSQLCDNQPTYERMLLDKRVQSKLDWIFSAVKPKKWEFKIMDNIHSDHKILIADISLEGFVACKSHFIKKNRGIALENCR